uniref:Uncharacterized protein n=1 Tax=Aegilops tauschii TaxID=37682 RepID=M8BMT0_AEGTA
MVLAVAVLYRHSKSRARAFLSALMRWRPRVNVLIVLCEQVVYHVMWLVESVVLVGRLCFFLMRFGFQQLWLHFSRYRHGVESGGHRRRLR